MALIHNNFEVLQESNHVAHEENENRDKENEQKNLDHREIVRRTTW